VDDPDADLSKVMTKRDLADLRRLERRVLAAARRERLRAHWRCFWTFPFGHRRNAAHICLFCGHDASYGEPALVPVRTRNRY
jgi:hypothetical protein